MRIFDRIYYSIYCLAWWVGNRKNQSHSLAGAFVAAFVLVHGIVIYYICSYFSDFKAIPSAEVKPYIVIATAILIAIACYYYFWKKNGDRVITEMEKRLNPKTAVKIGALVLTWITMGPLLTIAVIAIVKHLLK